MREILFRAKHTDPHNTIKWYYGYYERSDNSYHYIVEENGSIIPVNYRTLGQYTGLKDKNGTNVFEGDILRISKKSAALGTYYPEVPYPDVVVKWGFCAWVWETITKYKRYILFPDAWCYYSYEVIGNIYDNPELLEEENK